MCGSQFRYYFRYYEITGNRTDNLNFVAKSAVDTYNDNNHRAIKTAPNKAWTNINLQLAHHLKVMIQVYKTVPFNIVVGLLKSINE